MRDADKGAAVRTERLAVGYEGAALVEDVDLCVLPGQVTVLVGPNGAGKSTLLKTLAGQLAPVEGVAYLLGRRLDALDAHEQSMMRAVLLTERLRTELLTCEDVVGMGRYPHTGRMGVLRERDRAAVREAMGLMGVSELADKDFMRLSDGQRQRVMLARALSQEPRVLLLDEPTSYLDIRHQIELLGVLRHLAATRGLAIVMTLHELMLARQVADVVVCMREGRVMAQGTAREVFVPKVIDELFDLEPGMFDPQTGQISLGAVPKGVTPCGTELRRSEG